MKKWMLFYRSGSWHWSAWDERAKAYLSRCGVRKNITAFREENERPEDTKYPICQRCLSGVERDLAAGQAAGKTAGDA